MQKKKAMHPRLRTALRLLFPLLLIACIAMIFMFSRETGDHSSERSLAALEFINGLLAKLPFGWELSNLHVRKTAHFLEFFLLGNLLLCSLRVYTSRLLEHFGWPLFFALAVPVADETLQLFTPGRSGQLADVLLDFSGAFTGLITSLLLLRLSKAFWDAICVHELGHHTPKRA